MRSGWIVNSGVVYNAYQFEPDWDTEDISEEDRAEPVQAQLLQFFSIAKTHFLKAALLFSKLWTQNPIFKLHSQNLRLFLQKPNFHLKTVQSVLKTELCCPIMPRVNQN